MRRPAARADKRPRTVHAVDNPLRLRVAATASEARRLLRGGYCPVECSFGTVSVVDRLRMDHHGSLHHLPGVALRSYTDAFGARAARPRFVVTGHPDEDATWAIGSLAGLLPHPSREGEFRHAPEEMRRAWTRDWSGLARLINRVDTNPEPVDLLGSREGRIMLLWRLRGSYPLRDGIAFFAGIDRWRSLLTLATDTELDGAAPLLERRLTSMRRVRHERFGRDVLLVDSSIWGFSIIYAWQWFERPGASVLVVFQPRASGRGIVTVCARSPGAAERLFGPDGLLEVFGRLRPRGWGGRPVIGGSPRGRLLTWTEAREAARAVAASAARGKRVR